MKKTLLLAIAFLLTSTSVFAGQREIKGGDTDQPCVIRIVDSTDGTPETAVEHDTAGIDLWYRREGATKTSLTEAALAALDSAHSDGGIEAIGDGYYRLDLPDAAVAAAADGVQVGGTVTGMIVMGCYLEIVAYDPQDTVRLGLTALPNAAADAAAGLPISDAGGLDLDAIKAKTDNLPADPADDSDIDAQLLAIDNFVDDLETRLTAARAGYLDNINGHTAQTGDTYAVLPTNFSDLSITVTAGLVSLAADQSGVTIGTVTTNTDMRGTDNAALAATALSNATWTDARAGSIDELAAANIPTDLATIDTVVDGILADTGTDGVVVASLSASAVDQIIDEIIEGPLTVRQILRILLAKETGLTEGAGTATIKFRDLADTKYRIEGTITSGNRTSVTLDGS